MDINEKIELINKILCHPQSVVAAGARIKVEIKADDVGDVYFDIPKGSYQTVASLLPTRTVRFRLVDRPVDDQVRLCFRDVHPITIRHHLEVGRRFAVVFSTEVKLPESAWQPPVSQLFDLGGERPYSYAALGLTSDHVTVLMKLAFSPIFLEAPLPQLYEAPGHACRALIELHPAEVIKALPLFFEMADGIEDPSLFEEHELPALVPLGEPLLDICQALLDDPGQSLEVQYTVVAALSEIGRNKPELRMRCIDQLTALLRNSHKYGYDICGDAVSALVALDAKESLPVIDAAFRDGRVDETFCDSWKNVRRALGRPFTARELMFAARIRAMEEEPSCTPAERGSDDLPEVFGRDELMRLNPKIGRNDPCPCGSGKKYKKCCG